MKKKNVSLATVFAPRGNSKARSAQQTSSSAPGDISGYDGHYGFSCDWDFDYSIPEPENWDGAPVPETLSVTADDSATLSLGGISVSASYDKETQKPGTEKAFGSLLPGLYKANLSFKNIDYDPPEGNVAVLGFSISVGEAGTVIPPDNEPEPGEKENSCDCQSSDAGGENSDSSPSAARSRATPLSASEEDALPDSSSSAGRNTRLTATETYARWRTDFGKFRGMGGIPAGELEILAYAFSEKLASPEMLEFSHPLNSWLALPETGIAANAQLKVFTGGSYTSWLCDGSGENFFPIGTSKKTSARLAWNADKSGLCLTFPDKSAVSYSAETGEIISYQTKSGNAFSAAELSSCIDIVRDGDGVLRQIRNLWDGLMSVENVAESGYEIALYLPSRIGAKSSETGLYAVTGAAFKRFTVALSENGKLTITEKDAREGATAFPRSVWFENGAWNSSVGSGEEEIFTRRTRTALGDASFRIVTEVSRGSESVPASRVAETYSVDAALGSLRVSRTEAYGTDYAQTTSYGYDDSGRVIKETRPDGSVVESTYDSCGRLFARYEPFAGARCKTTYCRYVSDDSNSADLSSTQTVLSRTDGPLTLSETVYAYSETPEYRREERRTTALGSENTHLEVEETWLGTCGNVYARGRVKMRQAKNGVQTHYAYAGTSLHGALYTQTSETRVAGAAVAGKSVREVEFISSDGNVTRSEKYVFDSAGTWRLVSSADFEYDAQNRETKRTRGNGRVTRREMMCCGTLWEIDEDGVRTDYSYDSAQRLTEKMRALTETTPERISLYERDAEGRVTLETVKLNSVSFSEKAFAFDMLGRAVSETDELGRTTTRSYALDVASCTTETVTLPNGATRVTKTHADGTVLAETGTARRNVGIAADSVSDGTRLTRRIAGTSTDAGILLREIRNGFGEVIRSSKANALDALVYSYGTFNALGQLVRSETTGLAPTLYEYDAFGDETKRTVALADEPTSANSRVTETETRFETLEDGVYRVVSTTTYSASGTALVSSVATLVSESATLESKTVSTDVRGNATARWTEYGEPTERISKTQLPTAANVASVRVVDGFTVSRTDHSGSTTSFAREFRTGTNAGVTLTTTDARGNETVEERDVLGRATKKTDASGAVTTTVYAPGLDLPACVTDALGNARRFAYDLHGNAVAEYGAGTQPAVFAYDDADNRISQKLFRAESASADTDPRERSDGDETTWLYHAATGALLRKTYPDGNAVDYGYDSLNRLVSTPLAREVSDGVRLKITRAYAALTGELVSVSSNAGASETQTYAYNFLGQLMSQTDSSGTAAYAYDEYGSRVSETRTGTLFATAKTLAFHFDAFGRDVGYSIDGERKTTVSYDSATGRLSSVSVAGAGAFSWEYLAGTDLKSKLTYPNGATAEWSYEADRDLLESVKNTVNGNVISQYAYENDTLGRRTSMTKSGTMMNASETLAYGYNSRSELVSAVSDTDSSYAYAYEFDAIGNRETSSESGTSLVYTANSLNQYTSCGRSGVSPLSPDAGTQSDSPSGEATFQSLQDSNTEENSAFAPTYDADGNMTLIETSTGTWSVSYNAYNRPVTWMKSTGEKIYMMYDAQGRRVEKRVLNASGQRTLRERYVYVGYTCVQVLNGDGGNAVVKEFAWDPTEPVATRPLTFRYAPNGTMHFYCFDGNKNVSDLFFLAVNNGVSAHYEYAPFGAVTRTSKNTPFTLDFISLNPWRFSSEFYDPELDLVYYNFRHYSPSLGRFLSRDPIEEQGGFNLYAFVKNQVVSSFDLLGHETLPLCSMFSKTRKNGNQTEGRDVFQNSEPISVNGCGPDSVVGRIVPNGPWPLGLGVKFTDACDNHDRCYATCSVDKAYCDDTFEYEMKMLCWLNYTGPNNNSVAYEACLRAAEIYAAAVRNFGDSAYEQAHDDHCEWTPCCSNECGNER